MMGNEGTANCGKYRNVKKPSQKTLMCCIEKGRCFVSTKIWVFEASFFLYINYAAITDLTFSVKGKYIFCLFRTV